MTFQRKVVANDTCVRDDVVEAAGIEPASENLSAELSTGVVYLWYSLCPPPTNRLRSSVAPDTPQAAGLPFCGVHH